MHGLVRAAQSKGLSAAGIELSVDELRSNNIVHIVIDGTAHFSVVREITETGVKLADPKLGNIEMTRERFGEIFTGHALVISNPNVYVNGTMNQTNQSTEDTDTCELEKLASEEMLTIQGVGGVNRVTKHWWGFRVYTCNITTLSIVNTLAAGGVITGTITAILAPTGIGAKIGTVAAGIQALGAIVISQINIRNTGVRFWFTWPIPPTLRPKLFNIDAQRR